MEISDLWERLRPRLESQTRQGLSLNRIAGFCGVRTDTVRDWLSGKHPPKGERLLRLWHLLAAVGSDSPELDNLPAFNHLLSELVAYQVINLDEACEIAGASSQQRLHRILRGHKATKPQLSVEELDELYGSKLRTLQAKISNTVQRYLGHVAVQQVVTPPPTVPRAEAPVSTPKRRDLSHDLLKADSKLVLATLLGAALPLARQLDSPTTSAQERATFRDLIGQENLFDLSNLLTNLCSERARDQGRSGYQR